MIYYLPFSFEAVRDFSPTLAGVTLLGIIGGMLTFNAIVRLSCQDSKVFVERFGTIDVSPL